MTDTPPISPLPERPDEGDRPRIGVDEWVSRHGERAHVDPLRRALARVPNWAWLVTFASAGVVFGGVVDNEYVLRVGVDTLIYMLLALGLNVVVGYAGLLDLGYVAFFGFGAYLYAALSSDQFGLHWRTELVLPLVIVASAAVGYLLGLPSRRLLGDYLAIVTLFFLQIFIVFTSNANAFPFPRSDRTVDITGGPNGIANIDGLSFLGFDVRSVREHFFVALVFFVAVLAVLYLVNASRTGRAWRALREDPLAAEMMGMPVNRLKLLAFAFGAATAGLTGTVFASLQTGVFPTQFDLTILITIYAMVILGGSGSLAGVALGAITVNVIMEVLTEPQRSRWLFYVVMVVAIVALLRPWRWVPIVLGGVVAVGFLVRAVAEAQWERGTARAIQEGDALTRLIDGWVLLPANPRTIGSIAFVVLVAAILAVTLLRPTPRKLALIPLLYLAVFVWENRLVAEPSVTRLILLGAILVALMNARPQGLLGTSRVEIA